MALDSILGFLQTLKSHTHTANQHKNDDLQAHCCQIGSHVEKSE
jgi:hypothetical protein